MGKYYFSLLKHLLILFIRVQHFIQNSRTFIFSLSAGSLSTQSASFCSFQCRNGECIEDSQVCNGYRNCYDGSDERDSLCRGKNRMTS